MKKVPSALKWLAESRARHAHDLQRTERIAAEVLSTLKALRLDLAALDRAIQIYDPAINPQAIEPINATKGRYGAPGALRNAIKSILRDHAPHWLSTSNLELLVCYKLGIWFEIPSERRRWYRNSFANLLRKFVVAGIVERQQDPNIPTSEVGRWRWKEVATPTLADLSAASRLQSDSPAS